MMGDMSISPVAARRAAGRGRGRTGWVPATAPKSQQQGILLFNPGGPGASGLQWAPILASELPKSVVAEYDIVGFDPRGVGSSVPALSCDRSFFAGVRPNYIPASPAAEQVL